MNMKAWMRAHLNTFKLYPTPILRNEVGSSFLKSSELSQLCTAYVDPVNNGCDLGKLYPFTDIEKAVVRTLNKHM